MDIQTAAIITISGKLELLDKLLEKRISRAALDTVSPTLPVLEKVYELGEYRRLAANLAVMYHRLECALSKEEIECVRSAAGCKYGSDLDSKSAVRALKKARRVLCDLGINKFVLEEYEKLPLFKAECLRLKRIAKKKKRSVEGLIGTAQRQISSITPPV